MIFEDFYKFALLILSPLILIDCHYCNCKRRNNCANMCVSLCQKSSYKSKSLGWGQNVSK